jgi:nucleoside diphosphate kinase
MNIRAEGGITMQKPKMTIIVEETAVNTYRVRRTKNFAEPLVGEFIVGGDMTRDELKSLIRQGVDIIIDQAGYKRRWIP